jgi:hypothetical protein
MTLRFAELHKLLNALVSDWGFDLREAPSVLSQIVG